MTRHTPHFPLAIAVCLALVAAAGLPARPAEACPFCASIKMTLAEEIKQSDAAVLAQVVHQPAIDDKPAAADEPDLGGGDSAEAEFKIVDVLKGGHLLGKTRRIRTLYFGQQPKGTLFLIFAVDPKNLVWSTPTALSDRAAEYVTALNELPAAGVERLAFFQKYFEDEDRILAEDAYEEFAKAPYASVKELKDRMDRKQLLEWIRDNDVSATRRRLYLTMLGICGTQKDAAMLEEMLRGEDRQALTALDAMIACYVNLKGPEAMDLVDELFFKNMEAEYTHTYSALMAVRFLDQETETVPRERLMRTLRYMLDRPQLADLVIPDLARWQDWSVMEKLVKLFKEADEESSWVRVPVVNYLRACPLPKARQHMEELAKIDPEAVKRASLFPIASKPAAGGQAADSAGGLKKPADKDGASGSAAGGGTEKKAGSEEDTGAASQQGSGASEEGTDDAASAAPIQSGGVASQVASSASGTSGPAIEGQGAGEGFGEPATAAASQESPSQEGGAQENIATGGGDGANGGQSLAVDESLAIAIADGPAARPVDTIPAVALAPQAAPTAVQSSTVEEPLAPPPTPEEPAGPVPAEGQQKDQTEEASPDVVQTAAIPGPQADRRAAAARGKQSPPESGRLRVLLVSLGVGGGVFVLLLSILLGNRRQAPV